MLAALIANVNRDPKKRKKAFTVEDFMPKFGTQAGAGEEMSPETMTAYVAMMNELFGGTDMRQQT